MGDAPAGPAGKRRRGADEGCAGLRRVAEIVMVLAAAGEVRGGRAPTPAERALAAEARESLAAAVAEGAVRPKDLFPGEAVRAVVEDLGLNRAKDPAAMGFRPTKASIADRLVLTKRKMEEVKEAQARPTINTPQTVVSGGVSEFQSLHGASKFGVGTPRNQPAVAAMAGTAPLNSASLVISKPGSSPVKSVTNSSAVALPHTGAPHLKLEKEVYGPLNVAHSGGTIVHSTKSTQDTSARSNINAIQSSNQLPKNQDTKPVIVQTVTGNPVTGHRAAPGAAPKPTFANHNDIAKSVQQFLHQATNHPSWTPPSTEYMQSRLGCQICKAAIMDADSLLVCDACERGVHMNCLHQYGNKGVPKAEWHCSACLAQSKGKPLPPKYGKVTRTVAASKAAPPGAGAQFAVQGSSENMATKVNHQNLAANGNHIKMISTRASSTVHNSNVLALSATTASSHSQLTATSRPPSIGNAIKVETSSNGKEGTRQLCGSTVQHNVISPNKRLSSFSSSSVDSVNNTMVQGNEAAEISWVKCQDKSFAAGTEAKIKSEAHSEPHSRRDENAVDNGGASMTQTGIAATEEKLKDAVTSTHQVSNFTIEQKLPREAGTSEPQTINDVEMASNTGIPTYQSSDAAIEGKLQADVACEPNAIEDMEMSTTNAPSVDVSSNLPDEEKSRNEGKPPEITSSVNVVEFSSYAAIPTDQRQHTTGLTENGIKGPPNGEAYINKLDPNAASDHDITPKVAYNGMLHSRGESLCIHENNVVGINAEAKEESS